MRRVPEAVRDLSLAALAVGLLAGLVHIAGAREPAPCIDAEARARLIQLQRADAQRTAQIAGAVHALRRELREVRLHDQTANRGAAGYSSDRAR